MIIEHKETTTDRKGEFIRQMALFYPTIIYHQKVYQRLQQFFRGDLEEKSAKVWFIAS